MRRLEALPAMNRMQQLALALGLAQFLAEYDLPSSTADTNTFIASMRSTGASGVSQGL